MAKAVTRNPKREELTPAPDGVETDFNTSVPYKTGSISIWLNGFLLDPALDGGFTELNSTTIRMKEPPLTGDTISGQFDPT